MLFLYSLFIDNGNFTTGWFLDANINLGTSTVGNVYTIEFSFNFYAPNGSLATFYTPYKVLTSTRFLHDFLG